MRVPGFLPRADQSRYCAANLSAVTATVSSGNIRPAHVPVRPVGAWDVREAARSGIAANVPGKSSGEEHEQSKMKTEVDEKRAARMASLPPTLLPSFYDVEVAGLLPPAAPGRRVARRFPMQNEQSPSLIWPSRKTSGTSWRANADGLWGRNTRVSGFFRRGTQ